MSGADEGIALAIMFVLFQFGLVATSFVTLVMIPPAEQYYDACCVPDTCQPLAMAGLPEARTLENLCLLDPDLAGEFECPRAGLEISAGNCTLSNYCPKPGPEEQPFGRGVLMTQALFSFVQGTVMVFLMALAILQDRKKVISSKTTFYRAVVGLFGTAFVANLISCVSGLGVVVLWGTKAQPFEGSARQDFVFGGAECSFAGQVANRFIDESKDALMTVATVTLVMAIICFLGFVLGVLISCLEDSFWPTVRGRVDKDVDKDGGLQTELLPVGTAAAREPAA